MADNELKALQNKVAELEHRLGIPIKQKLSAKAAESGESRSAALQLPATSKSKDLATLISALADRHDVVVEWTAHEITQGIAAADTCCCCCCCCHGGAVSLPGVGALQR